MKQRADGEKFVAGLLGCTAEESMPFATASSAIAEVTQRRHAGASPSISHAGRAAPDVPPEAALLPADLPPPPPPI